MRVRSRTRQVYDAEYATAFGIKNRRARAGKTGEDIRVVLATFDEERLAFSDCGADTVRTDRLFGEDVAGGKLEALERRGQSPICFTPIEHLGVVVRDNNAHLDRTEVVYEFVNNGS